LSVEREREREECSACLRVQCLRVERDKQRGFMANVNEDFLKHVSVFFILFYFISHSGFSYDCIYIKSCNLYYVREVLTWIFELHTVWEKRSRNNTPEGNFMGNLKVSTSALVWT
jgi:hypothetical protein